MTRATGRRGVAAVWALVVVAVVSALTAAAAARMMAARRHVATHRERAQAEWLARAGYESAVDRLLTADGYTGEKLTPVPGGEVTVEVRPDPAAKGVYRVSSEARYAVPGRVVVARVERAVRRADGPDGVRVTPAAR
jgi:type II secretory pathway pseudopilin PulG